MCNKYFVLGLEKWTMGHQESDAGRGEERVERVVDQEIIFRTKA